jgi:hypothetical protein
MYRTIGGAVIVTSVPYERQFRPAAPGRGTTYALGRSPHYRNRTWNGSWSGRRDRAAPCRTYQGREPTSPRLTWPTAEWPERSSLTQALARLAAG